MIVQHAAQPGLHHRERRRSRSARRSHPRPRLFVLSDEVYEHVVFDGAQAHERAARIRSCASAASRCSRSARRCTPPAARRLLRRAGAAHARAAQGSSVQHVQHHASAAARDRGLSRAQPELARAGGVLPGQARSRAARARWRTGFVAAAGAGHVLPAARLQRVLARADDVQFAERLLTEARRRHDSAVAVLQRAAAAHVAAVVRGQERPDAG